MEIGGHNLDKSCFIIAELSANHGGSLGNCFGNNYGCEEGWG